MEQRACADVFLIVPAIRNAGTVVRRHLQLPIDPLWEALAH